MHLGNRVRHERILGRLLPEGWSGGGRSVLVLARPTFQSD